MQNLERDSTGFKVAVSIVAYSLCSSTLLLANKLTLFYLPRPGMVSSIQIGVATFAVLTFKHCCCVEVDPIEWSKVKPYILYVLAFVAAIYANMKALSESNVETIIVFRSLVPLATSVIDYTHMGRELPSRRSIFALSMLVLGAAIYCMCDSQLALRGWSAYSWVSAYFCLITFEMCYGKSLVSNVQMNSVWGSVLYTNILAFLPMTALAIATGDFSDSSYALSSLSVNGAMVLAFSCAAGTAIGYCGWLCRGMVSATSYTVVGVVNKFLTILLNVLLWEKHSSALGLLAVCGCLAASSMYEQAPLKTAGDGWYQPNLEKTPVPKSKAVGPPKLDTRSTRGESTVATESAKTSSPSAHSGDGYVNVSTT